MKIGEYNQFLFEQGNLIIPSFLLDKLQALDISPEELGYLILAIAKPNQGKDPWSGWALNKGWAVWQGEGVNRKIVFRPLWDRLYQIWEAEQTKQSEVELSGLNKADFDYCRIMKELDRMRGHLSVTSREQQLIQEFNIKYGWSTDFILAFFELCFKRGLTQIRAYRPMASQVNRAGIYTLEGLVSFMDDIDWTSKKAAEIKRDYLGLYGMVTVTERDLYVKWNIHWKLNHLVIVRAAQETIGANNASFKYLDKVLEDWHNKKVDSLEAAEAVIKERASLKKEAKNFNKSSSFNYPANSKLDNKRLVKRSNKNWEGVE